MVPQPALRAESAVRAGRPRDPACDAAILQAALELFAEDGYDALSIEGVAARAGVGKATVYRRYASKAALVVEAMRCGLDIEERLPDTGDLRADLTVMLEALRAALSGPHARLLITLFAERARNPELDAEFAEAVIGKKREHLRHLVCAAIERGELPQDTDVEIAAEAGPALLWHHALNNLPLDPDLVHRVVGLVLARAQM